MKVITEESIRQLLRNKKLHRGAQLLVAEPSIITPSAQSYLREYQIEVKQIIKEEVGQENDLQELVGGCVETADGHIQDLNYLDNEIGKLRNMLYFPLLPDVFFDEYLWEYWRVQQHSLEKFKATRYREVLSVPAPLMPQAFQFNSCSWRTWQHSVAELLRQMEYVTVLIRPFEQVSDSFIAWSKEILAIINNKY